jgi:hypothetical protein
MALEGVDPLTAFAIEEMDPLSKLAAEEVLIEKKYFCGNSLFQSRESRDSRPDKKLSEQKSEVEPWAGKKAGILSKYTTSEKISIVTSFLSDGEKGCL